jgi:hypothetical protein
MVDAAHFCMMMRGVQKQLSRTTTTKFLGEFRESASLRGEFLAAIGAHHAAALAQATPDQSHQAPSAQIVPFGRERPRSGFEQI